MRIKLSSLLSIIFIISFCFIIKPQSKYNLKYKFTKGQNLIYKVVSNSQITQQMMGQEMTFSNDAENIFQINVEDVNKNGDGKIIFKLDSAKVHSSIIGKDTTFYLKDLIGKKIELNFSNIGKLISYAELDTIEDASRYLSVSQEAKHFFINLAGKEIKNGGNWSSTQEDTMKTMGGEIVSHVDITYTLSGEETKLGHQCFKILLTSDIKAEGHGNMRGIEIGINGSGKSSGTLYLDTDNKMLIYSENNIDTEMNLSTSGEHAMTIPMTQSTKSVSTLVND